jgi:hypothetical protein
MAYIIYNNDGSVLLTLADSEIDDVSTGLTLVGKNVNNYGQYVNNNFTKLLTNFAGPDEPTGVHQVGQLWFDTVEGRLKVFDGGDFSPTYGATVSVSPPEFKNLGDLWHNPDSGQLKIWYVPSYSTGTMTTSTSNWVLIGPPNDKSLGKIGIEAPAVAILDNDFSQTKNVSVIYSYGSPVGLISTSTFNMSPDDSLLYLGSETTSTILPGFTISDSVEIRGDLIVNGKHKLDKNLSTYFDVSAWLDPLDGAIAESTRWDSLNASSNFIADDILNNLYPNTSTHFLEDSEVKVLAVYSTATYRSMTIRHFRLEESITGRLNWRPVDDYTDSGIFTSSTNIISTSTF